MFWLHESFTLFVKEKMSKEIAFIVQTKTKAYSFNRNGEILGILLLEKFFEKKVHFLHNHTSIVAESDYEYFSFNSNFQFIEKGRFFIEALLDLDCEFSVNMNAIHIEPYSQEEYILFLNMDLRPDLETHFLYTIAKSFYLKFISIIKPYGIRLPMYRQLENRFVSRIKLEILQDKKGSGSGIIHDRISSVIQDEIERLDIVQKLKTLNLD